MRTVRTVPLAAFAAIAALAAHASRDGVLSDIDFGVASNRVERSGKGAFSGVLPDGLVDNYTGWCAAWARTEARAEDGRRFLTFETEPGEQTQFAAAGFSIREPGVYKVTVRARTPGAAVLKCVARLGPPTYEDFLRFAFMSEDWEEKTAYFEVPGGRKERTSFYIHTSPGIVDVERITLERSTPEEFAATMRRPPKNVRNYLRHTRFPLGLPCGWNLGRNCVGTVAVAEDSGDGEGPVLRIAGPKSSDVFSEPFQTAYPGKPHTLRVRYRSNCQVVASVLDDAGNVVGRKKLPAASEWKDEGVAFVPGMLSEAFAVRFAVSGGTLRIAAVSVFPDALGAPPESRAEVALAPCGGDIADETRIHFSDEPSTFAWRVLDAPKGAMLRIVVHDLYGRSKDVASIALKGGAHEGGAADYGVFTDMPFGQFRLTGVIEKDGMRVSPVEETVVTRVARPRYWGRDAPRSPFGCHFNPNRMAVRSMKAAGVNWVRLHDSGENTSAWAALEPEKGKWTFRDDEVAAYREMNIKIFAQLGTAPKWATHYGDLGLKTFDYFERYLRPTNAVDWVNYVTTFVKRYDGVIDEYFVWNEPWSRWWRNAADAKFYDHERAARDFTELARIAYGAVKAVNPSIRVSGVNTHGGERGRKWTEECVAAGAFDICDAVDWHYYSTKSRAHRADANVTDLPFAPLTARHPGFGGKPVYMTEGQGANDGGSRRTYRGCGLYRETVPWLPDRREDFIGLADATCRFHVSLTSEGTTRLFIYTAHGYKCLAQRAEFQLLVGADGFATPTLAAHAQLARALEDKRFARKEEYGEKGLVFVFEGGGRTAEVYSDLTAREALALAAEKPVVDLFGNPVREETLLPGTLVYCND